MSSHRAIGAGTFVSSGWRECSLSDNLRRENGS